jgi:hypothetical protein
MIEWDILNLPRNGILKDYAPSIVVFDGSPKLCCPFTQLHGLYSQMTNI